MANPYLNIYHNNPTADGTDGTAISTDGTYTSPLVISLDASQSETKIATLAIRTVSGYQTSSDTTITISGDTNDHWGLSLDGTTWADSIVFSNTIVATNTIFYIKASADTTENPQNDRSVSLQVQTIITAV